MRHLTRRRFLAGSAAGVLTGPLLGARRGTAAESPAGSKSGRSFPLGACDWSLGRRQDPAAFQVAREIGLDGVEVSFGKPGSANDLRQAAVRERYARIAGETGVRLASLAMGILNQVPYAAEPETEQWVADAVEVMPEVGVKVCLLAFFGDGDIQGDRKRQAEVIRRLKRVAPAAERAGVVLGIESWLNAADHLRILDGVGSPAVQVYYDVANMTKQGYDVGREIRRLGAKRICQMHMKENGNLLGQGQVDFASVRAAVEDIDYRGWLVIEGATQPGKALVESYRQNREFLRELFGVS